ncbi:unnamed protein product [Coffea canephora]|uniref:DM2 domain-containing protein n=2 Tax=Coffea TaxID=13442 RepID=A0A068UZN9_COFCA|nr:uncharacterized protein LOC113688762 [Coffea arabica]CDP13762.1 unnamed protein product [Coffea canephora]
MSSERGGGRMVVSDRDIAEALDALLRESNPNSLPFNSINGIVQHLESKLGLNLSHKIDFIRSQIQLYFQPPPQHHKDHFTLHQNPNFHPHHHHHPVSAPHTQFHSPNFGFPHPQDYGFRPPPPLQQQQQQQTRPQLPPPLAAAVTSPTPAPVAAPEAPKESASSGKKRRGGPGGLNKLCGVSPELQAVVGQATMPRTEIVKQLWAYIRKNNLQDPNNKRKIICNDELRVVFETDCTDMFKMNKLLAKHIIPLEPTKQTAQNAKKAKIEVESGSESANTVPVVVISEALANFFGTDEREMSQAEVLRQVWEYIKVNQLEDPLNSMAIMCDAKLQELFGCQSISALGIPEMLARLHLLKKS